MKMTHQVLGLKELQQKLLRDVPSAVQPKVLRGALMAGMKPIVDSAKEKVPYDSSSDGPHLRDAISRASRVNKTGTGTTAAEAGLVMRSNKGKAGWRWHLIEFGTLAHNTFKNARRSALNRRNRAARARSGATDAEDIGQFVADLGLRVDGDHPGTKAQPFIRPAWDENIEKALRTFRDNMRKRIVKALKK